MGELFHLAEFSETRREFAFLSGSPDDLAGLCLHSVRSDRIGHLRALQPSTSVNPAHALGCSNVAYWRRARQRLIRRP
jgi:hypothetical protein